MKHRRDNWLTPLSWSDVDKALLVSTILLVAATTFALLTTYAGGWPYLPEATPPELIERIAGHARYVVLGWVLLIASGIAVRKRWPDHPVQVHAVIQGYAVTTFLFTYLTGPFNAAGWIAFIGGAIVGLILFSRTVVGLGILTWVIGMAGFAYLAETGALPYAPVARAASAGPHVDMWWLVRNGVIAFALCILILPLCAYIISSWRDRERQLEQLSRTDALTGTLNRGHLMELFDHELRQARRYHRPLSCVMIDLDHFKQINDEHGHLVGDDVLVGAADAIRRSLRGSDVVGRYGGEEFVVMLPNTAEDGAIEVAERCRRTIANVRVGDIGVSASFGVATYTGGDVDDLDDLLRTADEALYRAKQSGRNRVATAY